MKKNNLISVLISTVIIFIASFMQWGSINANPFGGIMDNSFPELNNVEVNMNAWNSNLTILGLKINNWIPIIVSIIILILFILRYKKIYKSNMVVIIILSICSIIHIILFSFVLIFKANIGIGSIITLIGFIVLLVSLIKEKISEKL